MQMDEHDRLCRRPDTDDATPLHSMADFDEADYLPHLEGLELTDEQASELLHIIWDMMRMCVEMDLPPESWGQIVSPIFQAAAADSSALD